MIAGLFQKVKEILTGNKFEKEDEEGRGFQRAVQRHDVVMCRKGLVDGCLRKLCDEFFLIKVGLG